MNGVLQAEMEVRDGVVEGVAKSWNDRGTLLGTYEIRNGNGVVRQWYDNGQLMSETPMVCGLFTGRGRIWWADGEIMSDDYWIRGRQVSRKRYFEACQSDPSLSNYADEPKVKARGSKISRVKWASKRKPSQEAFLANQRFVEQCLADKTRQEACAWLSEVAKSQTRTLGELPSWKESVALVEEAYQEEVVELCVVKVVREDGGEQTTGTLLARLPTSPKVRKRALHWCNRRIEDRGFEPETDVGQEWVAVILD